MAITRGYHRQRSCRPTKASRLATLAGNREAAKLSDQLFTMLPRVQEQREALCIPSVAAVDATFAF